MWYGRTTYKMATKTTASDAAEAIKNCNFLIIGIGAGLSAAGGQNYGDENLVKELHPYYHSIGFKGEFEILSNFWTIRQSKPEEYWGFWAKHINYMRYRDVVLQPYADLAKFAKSKKYFIITTNVDSQVDKAGFDKSRIYAPQGNYGLFQCINYCTDEVYDNKEMIDRMLEGMGDGISVRTEDIPKCPHCGDYLIPNLRSDDTFVETPHVKNMNDYHKFVNEAMDSGEKIVFLELGVGFNTPIIIRFPFEEFARHNDNATLVRVNLNEADVPSSIANRSVSIDGDLAQAMSEISRLCDLN